MGARNRSIVLLYCCCWVVSVVEGEVSQVSDVDVAQRGATACRSPEFSFECMLFTLQTYIIIFRRSKLSFPNPSHLTRTPNRRSPKLSARMERHKVYR
jgi:hypothetical protein